MVRLLSLRSYNTNNKLLSTLTLSCKNSSCHLYVKIWWSCATATEWHEERNTDPREKPEIKILKWTVSTRIFSARCSCLFSNISKVYPTHIHSNARLTPESNWEDPGEHTRNCPVCAGTWHPLQAGPLLGSTDIPPAWGNRTIPAAAVKYH